MIVPGFLVTCPETGRTLEYRLESDSWWYTFASDWPWGVELTPEEEAEELIALQPFHAMAVKIIALTGIVVSEDDFQYWES